MFDKVLLRLDTALYAAIHIQLLKINAFSRICLSQCLKHFIMMSRARKQLMQRNPRATFSL